MKQYIIWIGILLIAMSSCQKEVTIPEPNQTLYPSCFQEMIDQLTDNPECSEVAHLRRYEYNGESFYIIQTTYYVPDCILENKSIINKYMDADCISHELNHIIFCGTPPLVDEQPQPKEIIWQNY